MKSIHEFKSIFIHRDYVDMRKSINGLSVIVVSEMKLDHKTESLFIFTNKPRTHLKILYFDRSGFALWLKRLESAKFPWSKLQNLIADQRFEARQTEVKPYLEKIKSWCVERKDKILKTSALGNAIHYSINEYDELSGFIKDGRYEIDNGWIERGIRKFAIVSHNNWLFCDTIAGANASSLFYSLVLTAKLNEKDPFEVMTKIFQQLPVANTIDDYDKLAKLLMK